MSSPLMQQRLLVLHELTWQALAGLLGVLPASQLPAAATQQRQCTTALAFLCIFLGWLVPVYVAVRQRFHALSWPRLWGEPVGRHGTDAGSSSEQDGMQPNLPPAPANAGSSSSEAGGSRLGARARSASAWPHHQQALVSHCQAALLAWARCRQVLPASAQHPQQLK